MAKLTTKAKQVSKSKLVNNCYKDQNIDLNKNKNAESEEESCEKDKKDNRNINCGLLNECIEAFGTSDLYEILDLEKDKATQTEIKKAYYKLSLKCHPDKITDIHMKEVSKFKFQVLGKIYSILSDEEKKKIYDETGIIENENEFSSWENDKKDWDQYWRTLFKTINKEDIDKFYSDYKDSQEERIDLKRHYENSKGDFNKILDQMYSNNLAEDEPRFRSILLQMINNGEITEYDIFTNESKRKINKRKANYEKEAKEAEEMLKERGLDKSQDSLRNLILSRRKNENENFLEHLTKKYSNEASNKSKTRARTSDIEKNKDILDDEEFESEDDNLDHKPKQSKDKKLSLTSKLEKQKKTSGKKVKRL